MWRQWPSGHQRWAESTCFPTTTFPQSTQCPSIRWHTQSPPIVAMVHENIDEGTKGNSLETLLLASADQICSLLTKAEMSLPSRWILRDLLLFYRYLTMKVRRLSMLSFAGLSQEAVRCFSSCWETSRLSFLLRRQKSSSNSLMLCVSFVPIEIRNRK